VSIVERLSTPRRNLMTRRRFLTLALAAVPSISLSNSLLLDQFRLKVSRYDLQETVAPCKLVHISDLHHRGDIGFTENIITSIHKEKPDLVCFSGDLIDTSNRLAEALEVIRAIGFPVFGIPGNHDHTSSTTFQRHQRAFSATRSCAKIIHGRNRGEDNRTANGRNQGEPQGVP